ncbi:cell division control protein 6 homolog [Chrysoperla carnea]|uniref:cell division control protein 6 homolog n=1 Tax=Chrysoperla carnea TaxID=189513 RepID=UPI001D08B0FB|nr:cell division control protein 6 homolog [Chrysoperla carnea]
MVVTRNKKETTTLTPPKRVRRKKSIKKQNENSNEEILCSPSKIQCTTNSPISPSTLLNKLILEEPKIEPKRLFTDVKHEYKNLLKTLHSSIPNQMVGRDQEIQELSEFLQLHINDNKSGSVYISGPPGTGKTATLSYILKNYKFERSFHDIYLNCTSIKSSSSIFSHIAISLKLKVNGKTEKDYVNSLEKHFSTTSTPTLLILDELDQLESRKQSVLYTLFEWPARYVNSVILVGIANALDLTDRVLPRLQAHTSLRPKLMHFAPYKKEQIVEIMKQRLTEANVLDSFAPVAMQMLAGKVAAVSGDARRALDIGRRAVELADQQHKKVLQPLDSNCDIIHTKIELKDVMTVLNNVYTTSQSLNQTIEEGFPLQQKILLCCLILIIKKGKNKIITVGKLFDVYRKVCGKKNILAVDQSEFTSLLTLIESRGILRLSGKKDNIRLQKICLEWNEEDIFAIMKDKNLMSEILNDVSCLV